MIKQIKNVIPNRLVAICQARKNPIQREKKQQIIDDNKGKNITSRYIKNLTFHKVYNL
jgi:hypothetical protein